MPLSATTIFACCSVSVTVRKTLLASLCVRIFCSKLLRIGNRKNLVKWQDEFWQRMVKQYPELERGESASQTVREHIPPRIFKEMTQLTKQKEQLDALLVGITPFNGKSRAAEISKVLDSYIPNVARMKVLRRTDP